MSSRSTFSPSCEQTYCCFRRAPHFLCSQLKDTDAEDSADEYSLTGTETSPKEIVVDAIARALMSRPQHGGFTRVAAGTRHGRPRRRRPAPASRAVASRPQGLYISAKGTRTQ